MFRKTFIIAEAGVNHDGSLKKAFDLLMLLKKLSRYCKISNMENENIVIKKHLKHHINKFFKNQTQFEMLKK